MKSAKPESLSMVLSRFPEETHWLIHEYFRKYSFQFRITRPYRLRLGSFRASIGGGLAQININNDLGKYSFLLVFLHELAHYTVWKQYGRRSAPHGKEWKTAYYGLVLPLLDNDSLPRDLILCLDQYFHSKRASFQRDINFQRVLSLLDGKGPILLLGDISEKDIFHLMDGRQMVKIEQIRTRYKCYCPSNKRYYLISPAAQIFLPESQ